MNLKENIKDKIENIKEIEYKINFFKMEYLRKKIINLMEKKDYQNCIQLCDQFIDAYPSNNYIIREIKQFKLDSLKYISDNLIKENKNEEFIKIIKEISILKKDIDSELGINKNNDDLINIMSKVINEKAEYFNRNNFYNISENISDLGLQIAPNNIDLLTEKSISNSKKGLSYMNKAIENNDLILSIESDNFSAKLNKINNIFHLCINEVNDKYIYYLVEVINETEIIDGDSKVLIGRAIEVLIELIKKYNNKIYSFLQSNEKHNIFPKLKLLDYTLHIKELQYNSSQLLKIYYDSPNEKELIIDCNDKDVVNLQEKFYNKLFSKGLNYLTSLFNKKKIKKEDMHILELIENIILDNNIILEIKVNILFLYTKIDNFFIAQMNCYIIPINFIEFLFKFREEYSDYIQISLQVLNLLVINIKNIILSDSIKECLFKYIEKNAKNKKLMIDKSDIDEYLRKNKYDESKLEFTFESIKENFKKKYYEELINRVFTEDEIDVKLLKHLKDYGIDLESIINENKQKIKKNIEIILNIFSYYIINNFKDIKTRELKNINNLLEIDSDLIVKDSLINLIYSISNKKEYKNDIPMKLLVNISREIVKLSNLSINEHSERDDSSILMNNEKRIEILIDILYNFLIKKRNSETKKIDDSIYYNLCFYYNNKKVSKENKNKIIKIFKNNEKELDNKLKNIYEIYNLTNKLEENNTDNDKIKYISDIESKIKDGYELNINTTNTLNNIITDNRNNELIMNKVISLINTNVINNKKIDFFLSEKLINMFLDENCKFNKKIFDNLVICLINIIKNCNLDEQLSNTLYNNLFNFDKIKILNKIELIVISLKILTQRHYSFYKEQILNCIYLLVNENITKSDSQFKILEDIIIKSFNNQNLEKEIFNALFELLNKNIDLLDCISLCLLNSLKNKTQDEINILVNWNMKKFEILILNNYINFNMIDILSKASFNIFFNFEVVKTFVFFSIKLRDLKKNHDIESILVLISSGKIKICEYHIKIIEENLDLDGCFLLYVKMIETDEINLLKKIDLDKIVKNLYFDFTNGISIINKVIKSKIHFNENILNCLSNYLYNNHNEDNHNELHFQIKNLLNDISSFQDLSKTVKDKLEIDDFSFQEKNSEEKLCLFRDILLENKIPKRYFDKIKNIIDNQNILYNNKIKTLTHIFLHCLQEGEIIPDNLWKHLFLLLQNLKELNELKYILVNKNSSEFIKELFYEKFLDFLGNFSYVKFEDKINYLLELINIIDFNDIPNIDLQNVIIILLKDAQMNETQIIQIIFWLVKNKLENEHKTKLILMLKESNSKKYFENIILDNNFEKNIRISLYEILLDIQIKILCEKCQQNFEQVKFTILQYSQIEIKKDFDGIIIKYIQFLLSLILNGQLNIKRIFDYIEYFSIIGVDNNKEIINDKQYLEYLKEIWIKSIIKKEKNYSDNISTLLAKMFIKYDFGNNIIKNFIKIININKEENLNNFFSFYEKNNINTNILSNILFNDLNNNISLFELIDKIILFLIDNFETAGKICKKFGKIIYKTNRWDIDEIFQFLNFTHNIFDGLKEFQIDIIEDTLRETHFSFNKKNNKGETLLNILKNYKVNDWEYKIKQLGLPINADNQRTLDEIFSELIKKNSTIDNDFLKKMDELSKIFYEIEYEFHKERKGKKPIEKWDKGDILNWVNSKKTKENINKDSFIPELLSVICQANRLSDGYLPRKVQIVSILLFLFSPKKKGLFTQIKTGEGKTTIVAMLATIKALRGKYVDILTSSEVLAERDSKEKQKFYSMFNLKVTHAKKEKFHRYNIVYGDSLSFEGDILRALFIKNPNKSDIEFQRGQQCIIIDEVDNMCVDNLSASTQLVSEFGGYSAINGIYPLIYQNLNIIDQFILEGKFPDITQNNIQEKTIAKLIEITNKIIQDGINNKIFMFPKHIEDFVKNQVKRWCESAYLAKNIYKPNIHYVISGKEGSRKISPVDYKNTGVINLKMQWSNGLHQFLQLKHGVKLENETLNTTFLSHFIFISKYISPEENNVYGLSGTLGSQSTQKLLKKLFNVNVIIVPTFRKSNFINLYPKIEINEEDWKKSITDNILNPINNKRVILVICNTIKNVSILSDELISKNYPEHLIERYQRNDSDFKLRERYGPGNIIFATNLAGRGTDIKLTDEVERNGGMHVILTFLPDNQRVEEQAFGRTARSGKNGSGIIIMKYEYNKIVITNEDGKEIVINKMFEVISILREYKEKEKLDYILKNKIFTLKLKSEIFDKFVMLYKKLRIYLKQNKGYDERKINAILKDVEEKWGLWMKKHGLDEDVDYRKKNVILRSYNDFEIEITNDYFHSTYLNLLNPLNYISFGDYSLAYNNEKNSCFFAQYIKEMEELYGVKKDEEKDNLKIKVTDTIDKLQDNLQTSLEAMYTTITNLNNNICEEKENFRPYDDCKNDIKDKIDVIGKIVEGLKENLQTIESSKGNEKHALNVKKYVSISEITKNQDIQKYFYSMKIIGYYQIDIEVKKNWLGIIFSVSLGALVIIGGCILLYYTGGLFGLDLIEEGYSDIKYGFECLIGNKEFSWSEVKKKKLNFLIKVAVNTAINLLTGGFVKISKAQLGIKAVFKQVGKKLLKEAAMDIGVTALNHFIGPEIMEKVVGKVKEVLKKGVIEYFANKLKQMIPERIRSLLCINVVIYKGKNPVQRLLNEQLKIGIRSLSKLVRLFVDLLLSLFSMLNSSKKPMEILETLFDIAKNKSLLIFQDGLKDSLNSLVHGSISELWKLIRGELQNNNNLGIISTWSDYLIKGAKICNDIAEAENLTSLLVQNGILSLDGELNGDKVLGEKENVECPSKNKFKLNLGINFPLRNISKKLLASPIEKIKNYTFDLLNEIKFRLEQEIQSLISRANEFYYIGINFLIEKKEEMKNTIKDKINYYKDKIIQDAISFVNNLKKSIINSTKYQKELLNEGYTNLQNIFNDIEKNFNSKLKDFANKIISDNFGECDIIKMINNKININQIIDKIEIVSKKIHSISDEILNKYIPIIETINSITNFDIGKKLVEFIEKIKKILNTMIPLLEKKIIPIISFIKKSKEELDNKGLINFIIDQIKIPINSNKIMRSMNNIKNKYIEINENNSNAILSKFDDIINYIYDLDDKINQKENEILDTLFKPCDEIIDKLKQISEKIRNKLNDIISYFMQKIDIASNDLKELSEKLFDNALDTCDKLISKIPGSENIEKNIIKTIQKGDKYFNKAKTALKKVSKISTDLMEKFQSLQEGINKYEQSSQMDETINILNDIIIDELINILSQALQNSKIGELINKGSKALLNKMESTKKNLREELKSIAVIPEKENKNSLIKIFNSNGANFSKFKLDKIQELLKKFINVIKDMASNIFKNNFKYPEGSQAIVYINSKLNGNPFKKILLNQLKIFLNSLKDIIPILSGFLKKIISVLKCDDDPFSTIKSLADDFSNESLSKLKESVSKSIENLKIGILSFIKNLFFGQLKNKNCEMIISWSDYFIKGMKICRNVSEAESLSKILIENGIISIDGELNKDKILDVRELNQIKIKNFPLKLKVNLKDGYKEIKSTVQRKIKNVIDFDPREKINEIIFDLETKINSIIKEHIEKNIQKCSYFIKQGIQFVLDKENYCKKLIKDKINLYIEKYFKEFINAIDSGKDIFKKGTNTIVNEIKDFHSSIGDKINNAEETIKDKIKEITTSLIDNVFGNFELMKNLKETINLDAIIEYINNASANINDSILNIKDKFLTKINECLSYFKDLINNDGLIKDLNEKINNLFKSFLYRLNNDISPVLENIKKIKIQADEFDIKQFLIDKINNSIINSFSVMDDIKERYKQLNFIENNINEKKDEILNNIEYLKSSLYKAYDAILKKEDIILNKIFEPCDKFIEHLNKISDEIMKKINNVILPLILSIIKDYLDKINNYCSNIITGFIDKIDNYGTNLIENAENTINNQLIKYEQKAVDMAEKGFGTIKNALKKIKFNEIDNLIKGFQNLCEDIKDYDESENESEIISELCDAIQIEFKKMISDCIIESGLCKLLEIEQTTLMKGLGLIEEK